MAWGWAGHRPVLAQDAPDGRKKEERMADETTTGMVPTTPGGPPAPAGGSRQLSKMFNLTPQNLTEAIEFSKLMAKSEVVPKEYIGKPANILVAVQMGMELGLSPIQAVNSIAVINGKPTMYGDAPLAVIKASGVLDPNFAQGGIDERSPEECLAAAEGRCAVKRKDQAQPTIRTFSRADAEKAGLYRRSGPTGPWNTYEGRMLMFRARGWALRDSCPDVLKGLRIAEEESDVPVQATEYEIKKPASRSEAIKPGDADAISNQPERPAGGSAAPRPQGGGGGGPASTEGDTWKGTITKVDNRKGKGPYTIHGDKGMEFKTFSNTHADVAKTAADTETDVVVKFSKDQYGLKVQTIGPVQDGDTSAGDEQEEPGANG